MGLKYINNNFCGITSQNDEFDIICKDINTGKDVRRVTITSADNIRMDKSTDGITGNPLKYICCSDRVFLIDRGNIQDTLAGGRAQGVTIEWIDSRYRAAVGQSVNGYMLNLPFGDTELLQLYFNSSKSYGRGTSSGALDSSGHEI